jgi:capsular exopolysaccharide synthesis family protein
VSRIDQALRVSEGAADTTALPGKPDADALRQFSHETPGRSTRPEFKAESTKVRTENPQLQARLVSTTPNTVSVEQYRRLAAALHDEQVESELKTVMITSAVPGDGKTLTVVNLALTLAESFERRVLIIDADLRMPALHEALEIPNARGLSEALATKRELSFVDVAPHVSVLTAGKPGRAPLAGLISERMSEIVNECERQFDWVLIDTPPVGVLPDAQVLGRLVGAVILVVGAGSTPSDAVERAVEELGGPDSIFGIVLNRVEERRISGANYYGQYRAKRPRG